MINNFNRQILSPFKKIIFTIFVLVNCVGFSHAVAQAVIKTASGNNKAAICNGNSVDLVATWPQAAAPLSFLWSNGDINQTTTAFTSGLYSVTITDNNAATSTAEINVGTGTTPTFILSGNKIDPQNPGSFEYCQDETVVISAPASSAYASYKWNLNQANTQSISIPTGASAAPSAVYSVTITDLNGCEASQSVVAIKNAKPQPFINPTSFCTSLPVILSPGNYQSYKWSTGATTPTISYSTNNTTPVNFSVTVTDTKGCTGNTTNTITPKTGTTPTITGQASICGSEAAVLNAGAGYNSYLWSNGDITPTIAANFVGTYAVTITDQNGCKGTASILVNKTSAIAFSVPDRALCNNSSVKLDAVGSFSTYRWANSQGSTISTQSSVTVSSTGTYFVTVSNSSGCTATAQSVVSNSIISPPQVTGPQVVCTGTYILLSVLDPSNVVSYAWNDGRKSEQDTIASAGYYRVKITDKNGCTATSSYYNVLEQEGPKPVISDNGVLCTGTSKKLSVTGTYTSYHWSNGVQSKSININSAGTYVVTVTDKNTCQGSTSVAISIGLLPMPSFVGDSIICGGKPVKLAVNGFNSVMWSNESTDPVQTFTEAGKFSVTVTDNFGCMGTNKIEIYSFANPDVSISGPKLICQGQTASLSVSASFVKYKWNTGETGNTITKDHTGIFVVTVTDNNTCTAQAQQIVNVLAYPSPSISSNGEKCEGSSALLSTASYTSYLWNTGEKTQKISINYPGTYTVTVSNEANCKSSAKINYEFSPLPVANFSADFNGLVVRFSNTSTPVSNKVLWDFGDGDTISNVSFPIHTYKAEGVYTVLLTVFNACGQDVIARQIVVNNTTALASLSTLPVMAFPNPSSGKLTVDLRQLKSSAQYSLLDAKGAVVETGTLKAGEQNDLNLEKLEGGFYILKVENPQGSFIHKISLIK